MADGVRSKVTLSLVTMLRGSTPRTAERRGRAGNLPVGVDASVAVMAPRKPGGDPSVVGGPPREASVALRVPAHAPWLARRSMARRATRMTWHAPVRTGGAVGAG